MTIGLSPEKSRGFSGEGSVLASLVSGVEPEAIRLVSSMLDFESQIDPVRLAETAKLSGTEMQPILGALASFGQLGFDFGTDAYFHRPFPMREESLSDLHPRFADARKLIEDGRVSLDDDGSYLVHSADSEYRVVLGAYATDDRCTCLWYTKYRGTRGPCKHALAARTFATGTPAPDMTA
jgi:SWIM zinc finger